MEHRLAMDIEEMRRAGYAVDAIVARLADPAAEPMLRRADAAAMRSGLGGRHRSGLPSGGQGSTRRRRSALVVRRARQQVAALFCEHKPVRQLLTFG